MTEETTRLIAAAISAAGPIGTNVHDWEQRVEAAIPVVATMFDDESWPAKRADAMAEAKLYVGLYLDHHLEEASNRYVLRTDPEKLDPKTHEPVIDEIRTEFRTSHIGRRQESLLNGCKRGDRLAIWRVNEKMKNDAMKNVRVAYHIKVIRRADQQTAVSPDPAGSPLARTGPTPSGPSAPAAVFDIFRQLPTGMRGRVVATARQKGVTITNRMSVDEEMIVMQIIQAEQPSPEESF